MRSECVLSLDPGETTAYVVAQVIPWNPVDHEIAVDIRPYDIGKWHGIQEFDDITASLFMMYDIKRIVVEDYIIYPNRARSHTGSKVYTAREIGRIEYVAYLRRITKDNGRLVFQAASMAKQRWPDNRLNQYVPRNAWSDRHQLDAIRHLMTWAERTYDVIGVTWLGEDERSGNE
jgi:hypothetical protein